MNSTGYLINKDSKNELKALETLELKAFRRDYSIFAEL